MSRGPSTRGGRAITCGNIGVVRGPRVKSTIEVERDHAELMRQVRAASLGRNVARTLNQRGIIWQ